MNFTRHSVALKPSENAVPFIRIRRISQEAVRLKENSISDPKHEGTLDLLTRVMQDLLEINDRGEEDMEETPELSLKSSAKIESTSFKIRVQKTHSYREVLVSYLGNQGYSSSWTVSDLSVQNG